MKLPPPPSSYESASEFQRNRTLEAEDAKNYKRGSDVGVYPPNKLIVGDAQFLTDGTHTPSTGSMSWNSVDQTIDIGMDYGVVLQVGQETYVRAQNSTGSTIPNGTVVGFAGVGAGQVVSVTPYLANGSQPTLYILGVMTHALANGQIGYCTTFGHVRNVNTSAFSVGDIVYASSTVAGGLTKVKPTAPNNVVPVAAVLKVGTTDGELFVRPTIDQQRYYGEFTKTDSQTPAAINTAYALTFTNTEIASGISRGSPTSRIVIATAGLYNIIVSTQITSSNASHKDIWVWLRLNGSTNIANSSRIASSSLNGGYLTISIDELISVSAGDYIEVMFASSDTGVSVSTVAATAFAPAAPAAILSVTQAAL
jgi:hypothetical protein